MLLNQFSRRLPQWVVPVLGSLLMMPILPTVFDSSSLSTQQVQIRPNAEEPSSDPSRMAAAIAILGLGAGTLIWSWKNMTSAHTISNSAPINRSLQRRLNSLLHDDRQAATRLVQQVQAKHPERSIDWCIEKVIYDLQRDRR